MKRSVIFLLQISLLMVGCSSPTESGGAVSDSLQVSDTLPNGTSEPEEAETVAESALPASTTTTPATTTTATTTETEQTSTTATPETTTQTTVTTSATPAAPPETEQITHATTPATAPQTTVTTPATPAAPSETTVPEETEPLVEENKYDLPVFIEYTYNHPVTTIYGATKEYLLVTVIPEKIYWNDPKQFDAEEGSPLNILIPSIMYDTMKNADSTVLHFNSYNSFPNEERTLRFLPKSDNNKELTYDNVIRGDYWDIDDMFIIKDGVLAEFEYTEEMRKFLLGQNYDCGMLSSIMLDYDPDKFYYGMTVEEFDTFFEDTHQYRLKREAEIERSREETIEATICLLDEGDLSHYFFIEGTEMRVRLA